MGGAGGEEAMMTPDGPHLVIASAESTAGGAVTLLVELVGDVPNMTGFQFDVRYDPRWLVARAQEQNPPGVMPASDVLRSGHEVAANVRAAGDWRVLGFNFMGGIVVDDENGDDRRSLVELSFTVAADAPPGTEIDVILEDQVLSSPQANVIVVETMNGEVVVVEE
jgi:hypothetical protein